MGNEIDFVAFSDDCRVEGKVDLEEARLADLLNGSSSIVVRDVTLVSTRDGHKQEFERLEINRDELDIVVANGPRGDSRRRLATRPNSVSLKLGPYAAEGFMHAPPTADPVAGIFHRPAMVAITDAVLEYEFCDETVSEWFRTLLVNRELAVSLRALTTPGSMQPGAA
ncbi:MAG TPA: hypothetical protein VGE81_02470 [Candidatus Limnocylindrales bacterium]|jgi:hypothetical protein